MKQLLNQVNNMKEENKSLTDLNREQLGLISVKDLQNIEDMSSEDRKSYVGRVATVYDIIKEECENAIRLQTDHAIRKAKSWEDILIARGSINGIALILEWFTDLNNEHLENIKPKEKFDKYTVV